MIENNRNNEQIYGRNDMIMLDQNNKIYGSLGIADKYVMKTEEGTRLILSNPKQGRFGDVLTEFNMYGRSEQKQYKGINLIPPNMKYGEFVEVSIPKGTKVFMITDGTSTMGGNLRFFNADKTQDMWFSIDEGEVTSTGTLRIDAKYVQYILSGGFESSKLCLGIGNEPIYEPYVGGKPSPSPDYPQEIKSVVNPTVKVCGKNLLDCRSALSRTVGGISFINNKDGSFSISGKNTLSYNAYDIEFMVSQSGTYKAYRGTNSPIPIVIIYDPEAGENVAVITDSGETFQLKKGKLYYYSIAFTDVSSDIDVTYKPFLTVDVTGTYADYEPYTGQSITLPYTLNAIPVASGGNVTIDGQQYIADRVVEKDGVFGIERNIREIHTNTKTMNNREEFPGWDKVKGISDVIYYNEQPVGDSRKLISISNFTQTYLIQNDVETNNILFCLSELVGYSQSELIAKAIDVDMYIRLQDAIFEPFPVDIQDKLRTLVTYYPVTIVENNYNTWMKATYKSIESV